MLLCLAVLSAYSFYSTGLTLRLFPLFCLLPLFDLSCRRSSADNTGGGSGGPGLPGNFLTNHIASVTCCILASQLAPLCVHCGETGPCLVTLWQCGNSTICAVWWVRCPQMCTLRRSNLCDHGSRVSVCMSASWGAWLAERCIIFFSAASGNFCCLNSPPCVTGIYSLTAFKWGPIDSAVWLISAISQLFSQFLYLPISLLHLVFLSSSAADVVVHCVWGGTRAHPWPIGWEHLSGTHKLVLPACVICGYATNNSF